MRGARHLSSALSHLRSAAADFGAAHLGDNGADAIYSVRPPLPSGAPPTTYVIRISPRSTSVVAREDEPVSLPAYCPERHIVSGGTFCLYWAEVEPLGIDNAEAASLWWGKLVMFLLRQAVARKQRRWPGKGEARAHGPRAAKFQAQAEGAASRLGEPFVAALRFGRLTTKACRRDGGARVRLLLDGRRVVTALEKPHRAMTLRARCPCARPEGRTLGTCGDHAAAFTDLTLAMEGWRSAERDFFEAAKTAGMTCCGTIDGCPLSAPQVPKLLEAA